MGGVAKIVLIAPLYLSMVAGTGGAYTAANLPLALSQTQNPVFEIRGLRTKRDQVLSVSQHLANIRETLGLRMSEISQIFGVTRPAAYAWVNGTEPKPELRIRILRLSRLVEELQNAGVEKVDMLARLPIANDQSLVDLLTSGSDVHHAFASMKQIATGSMQRGQASRDFGPASRRRKVSIDAISVPVISNVVKQS
jgi:hypothetical protein